METTEGFIAIKCEHCNSEIEASPDLAGTEAECPACGMRLMIPAHNHGVVRHGLGDDDAAKNQALKSRTIRIELGDL